MTWHALRPALSARYIALTLATGITHSYDIVVLQRTQRSYYEMLKKKAPVMLSCHKSKKARARKTHISNPLCQHWLLDMLGGEEKE